MALLAPLFLIGLLAIGLPIWLHRLQTQIPERKPFSSTMLLEQSRQQVHLQKKLQYLLLLALRISLLVLLVFAFTKPVWERDSAVTIQEGAVLHLLVIDTSFSMRYGDWFERARAQARQIVADMAASDVAQVLTASNNLQVVTEATDVPAELTAAINTLQPGAGHLDLGVMVAGIDSLIRDQRRNIRVHVFSDFQSGGLPGRFADLVPGSRPGYLTGLELHPVSTEVENINLYVDTITRTPSGLEIGVRGNNSEPVDITLALNINGALLQQQTGTLSATGQTGFSFSVAAYEAGDNRIEAIVSADADALAADNTRYAVVENTPPSPVLLLTTDLQSLPVKYLTAALEASQQGYRAEPVNINEFDPRVLQRYPWVIIDDLGIINATLAPELLEYLRAGGAVLAAAGARALAQPRLPLLDYTVRQAVLEAVDAQPRTVTRIDASHPVLAGTSGWRDINVTRYLDPVTDASALNMISLDNGAPLLLEQRFDQGRLLLLTSSLDNRWNDLPIRPVFVNFIAEAARYLSGRDQLKRNQIAGDFLQLLRSGSAAGQVVAPDGSTVLSLADTHRSQQIRLDMVGFYEIYTTDSEQLIAVNPDLRESNLALMNTEDLNRWKQAALGQPAAAAAAGEVKIQQDPVQLWHILLVLLGIIVLVESLLGNRYLGAGRGPV